MIQEQQQVRGRSHLRIKDTRIRLHNANGFIESLQRIRCALLIRNHSRQIKFQILRLQLRRKAVADAILLPAWNLNIVSGGSEITDDCRAVSTEVRSPEVAANEDDGNGFGLFVADGEEGLGRVAVHQLDTEYF